MGNLYHLNAEEEPELSDYPDPEMYSNFAKNFGPHGLIHSCAGGKIEDPGPLTKKRMETVDEETLATAIRFIREAVKSGEPFFVWWNCKYNLVSFCNAHRSGSLEIDIAEVINLQENFRSEVGLFFIDLTEL